MSQRCFLLSIHFLIDERKIYRENLPAHLIRQRFLLILEGHISRWSFEAISVLRDARIDVPVLPPHCTHVLQACHVWIAAALKTRLAELCQTFVLALTQTGVNELICARYAPQWLADKRHVLLRALPSRGTKR
jgi:hypothetical protein